MVNLSSGDYFVKKGSVFSILKKATIFFFFKGERVRCNVCSKNFKNFDKDEITKRENARCPACNSLESTRNLWFYLSNEVLGKKNKNKFLYFSPEPVLLEKLKRFNIELEERLLEYFNNLQIPNFEKLPGSRYDVIIFSHLLQYVKDDQTVFSELKRLLRPGGFVIILTLINWEMDRTYEKPVTDEDRDRLNRFYEPGLERVYGADFQKRLVKAGFGVETIDYADQLGSVAREYYRLGDGTREIIFKCKKSNNKIIWK
jgi:SAM-dependent methyltransferase